MTKLSELEGKLDEVLTAVRSSTDEVVKGTAEVIQRITDLENALTDPDVPGGVETALANLKTAGDDLQAAAQTLDGIVPDAPPPPES